MRTFSAALVSPLPRDRHPWRASSDYPPILLPKGLGLPAYLSRPVFAIKNSQRDKEITFGVDVRRSV